MVINDIDSLKNPIQMGFCPFLHLRKIEAIYNFDMELKGLFIQ